MLNSGPLFSAKIFLQYCDKLPFFWGIITLLYQIIHQRYCPNIFTIINLYIVYFCICNQWMKLNFLILFLNMHYLHLRQQRSLELRKAWLDNFSCKFNLTLGAIRSTCVIIYFNPKNLDGWFCISGIKLTIRETRFAIHFDNFTEHFSLIFVKFANQSLIVSLVLSLNKDNMREVRNEITLVLVKNKISYTCYITVTFARALIRWLVVLTLIL